MRWMKFCRKNTRQDNHGSTNVVAGTCASVIPHLASGFRQQALARRFAFHSRLLIASTYESDWQVEYQLFGASLLRISRNLPSIQVESRPTGLVIVVTDF